MLQDDISRLFFKLLHLPSPRIPKTPFSQPFLDLLQWSTLYLPLPVVGEFHFAMAMAMFISMPHTYKKRQEFFVSQRVSVHCRTKRLYAAFQKLVIKHSKANCAEVSVTALYVTTTITFMKQLCKFYVPEKQLFPTFINALQRHQGPPTCKLPRIHRKVRVQFEISNLGMAEL